MGDPRAVGDNLKGLAIGLQGAINGATGAAQGLCLLMGERGSTTGGSGGASGGRTGDSRCAAGPSTAGS